MGCFNALYGLAFITSLLFLFKKGPPEAVRIILLTGTPAVNNPFELALIYNLLRFQYYIRKIIRTYRLYFRVQGSGHDLTINRDGDDNSDNSQGNHSPVAASFMTIMEVSDV